MSDVLSLIVKISCKAFDTPIPTSTYDLTALNKFLSKLNTVVAAAETVDSKLDWYIEVLSWPLFCVFNLNL